MNWTFATRTTIAAAALATVIAGCSSDDSDNAAPSTISATTTAATSTPTPPEGLGAERTFTGANGLAVRVAVLGFDAAAAPDAPAPAGGGHWAAAEVRTCVDGAPQQVSVDWSPWTALDTTDGRYPHSSLTYNQFPLPQYPFSSEPVNVGECVRGWVVFPVADGATINRIRYAANENATATWNVAGAPAPAPSVEQPTTAATAAATIEPEPEPYVEDTEPSVPATGIVTVGQPCSSPSSIGVDVNTGNDIVCVFTGGGGNRWVMSAPIQGVNDVGDPCTSTDNVSRTPAGKAIMCVNGQWVYGP